MISKKKNTCGPVSRNQSSLGGELNTCHTVSQPPEADGSPPPQHGGVRWAQALRLFPIRVGDGFAVLGLAHAGGK